MHASVRALSFALCACLASALQAHGQDGSFYLQACGAAVKQSDGGQLTQDEGLGAIYCGSYIDGFLDAMSLTTTLSKGNKIASGSR